MRTVKVPLGTRAYSVVIGRRVADRLGRACARLGFEPRCVVITDSQVGPRYAPRVLASLRKAGFQPGLVTVPAGELSKSVRQVEACYEQLAGHQVERHSFLVALGGGVVGDLAGFVAATYLRGISFVQVPTTLLAQVDSSVGGKTGVNLPAGKNLVGAFHQPRLVMCDLATLDTLPEREFRSGLAEVIKYGIIADAAFFGQVEADLDRLREREEAALGAVVARSCEIKADIVGQDETEGGLRAVLNFGHTIGHALEAISGYGQYLHGEAISIGQVVAAHLSARLCGLPPADVTRIQALFAGAGLPTSVKLTAPQRKRLLAAMRLDKKVSGGQVKFVLAEAIGRVRWGLAVPEKAIWQAFEAAAAVQT
jgi:3-dehydroquinate synthase